MQTFALKPFFNHKHIFMVIALVVAVSILSKFICIDTLGQFCMQLESVWLMYSVSALLMMVSAVSPFPAEVVVLLNAAVYSGHEAFWVSWLSAIIAAQATYEVGRYAPLYKDSRSQKLQQIIGKLKGQKYKALFIMRLVPVVPFFLLNLLSGMLRLNRAKYLCITSLTILPAIIFLSWMPQWFK